MKKVATGAAGAKSKTAGTGKTAGARQTGNRRKPLTPEQLDALDKELKGHEIDDEETGEDSQIFEALKPLFEVGAEILKVYAMSRIKAGEDKEKEDRDPMQAIDNVANAIANACHIMNCTPSHIMPLVKLNLPKYINPVLNERDNY